MARIICIGGGAASFFFASNVAEAMRGHDITILEQGRQVLGKVRISGGGRCNVTHHCFEAAELVLNYPRGGKLLEKAFSVFGPRDTAKWFADRGVELKTEEDGRMFPVSNSSQTIIDCLVSACRFNGVGIRTESKVKNIRVLNDGRFRVDLLRQKAVECDMLFVGTGSSKQIWQVLGHLECSVISPVPSLFTFRISDPRLESLAGVSVPSVRIRVPGTDLVSDGPLLITHRGLSGPAILKLSAFGARYFHSQDYTVDIEIDFRPDLENGSIRHWRDTFARKLVGNHQVLGLPRRLAASLVAEAGLDPRKKLASHSNREMDALERAVRSARFQVTGQNRFKDEFVTAGGVDLNEIDLDRFACEKYPGMYMAGEVLNIDGVTGGFNFQAAWTGAYIAAQDVVNNAALHSRFEAS